MQHFLGDGESLPGVALRVTFGEKEPEIPVSSRERADTNALTEVQYRSPLGRRPYDLRHAASRCG